MKRRFVRDHTGKRFNNIKVMCNTYHIPVSLYKERIKRRWSVKDALTLSESYGVTPPEVNKEDTNVKNKTTKDKEKNTMGKGKGIVTDHLGNQFANTSQMCKHWGVVQGTFAKRIENGWSLERALTEPANLLFGNKPAGKPINYKGKHYTSISKFCQAHNLMSEYDVVSRILRESNGNNLKIERELDNLIYSKNSLSNAKVPDKALKASGIKAKSMNISSSVITLMDEGIDKLTMAGGYLMGNVDDRTLINYSNLMSEIKEIRNILESLKD